MRRRLLVLLAAGVAAGSVGVVAAWAGFPNILGFGEPAIVYGGDESASAARSSGGGGGGGDFSDPRVQIEDIHVVDIDYDYVVVTISAPFEAEYVCVKRGRVTSRSLKLTHVERVKTSARIAADESGEGRGSILTDALPSPAEAAASEGFSCPTGQTLEFDRVVFSDMTLNAQGGEREKLHVTLVSESVHGLD
jgi:hypothetical protein